MLPPPFDAIIKIETDRLKADGIPPDVLMKRKRMGDAQKEGEYEGCRP
jgi:hypothetical protein